MSEITDAFDAPWIEPVQGFDDVKFARADLDYWGLWCDQVKKKRIADDLAKFRAVPVVDPIRRMEVERKIEDQKVYLGEVIDLQHTSDGLKKILVDSIVRGGRTKEQAEAIRKRIGPGRQMQLASIVCSEPMPTIEEYRQAVRAMCKKRAMSQDQIARLTDADLIRLAHEMPVQLPEKSEGESENFPEGGPIDTTQ